MRRHGLGRFTRGPSNDRGVALVWTAMVLLVLLVFTGGAVDANNWHRNVTLIQNAADAAALAGVPYLPDDLGAATEAALAVAARNGYRDDDDIDISITQAPDNAFRLEVRITHRVRNHFLGIIGLESITIGRTAVAEAVAPVSMGSPDSRLGRDPDTPSYADPGIWLQMAGPAGHKVNADRYAQRYCTTTPNMVVYRCDGSKPLPNSEFDPNGYRYSVIATTSGTLNIEIFDPMFTPIRPCATISNAEAAALNAKYGAAYGAERYTVSANPARCPGDQMSSGETWRDYDLVAGSQVTTAIVRAPDATPWNDLDNPVIARCTTPFGTQRLGSGASTDPVTTTPFAALDGSGYNLSDSIPTFAETYRRWYPLCSIPAAAAGDEYIVQVVTSGTVIPTGPTDIRIEPASPEWNGHNRFSIRAAIGSPAQPSAQAMATVAARGRLPIQAAVADTASFHLIKVLPNMAGRTLVVEFNDLGDNAQQNSFLQIVPPTGQRFGHCSAKRDDDTGAMVDLPMHGATCTLSDLRAYSNVRSGTRMSDGRVIQIVVPIPPDYTCDPNVSGECWIRALINYGASGVVYDGTTWSASINGDPVRLVN